MGLASLSEIILPLLGGFLFALIFRPLRFMLAGDAGQRLLLISASLGIILALFGHFLGSILIAVSPSWGATLWNFVSPFPIGQMLAAGTGPLVAYLLNRFQKFDEVGSHRLAHQFLQNKLALLLSRALEQRKPVMVTLYSGKVYVGFLKDSVTSINSSAYMELIPMISGYREPIDREGCSGGKGDPTRIHFNTYYQELTYSLLEMDSSLLSGEERGQDSVHVLEVEWEDGTASQFEFDPSDIGITIPIDQIEVATIFSKTIYDYFNPPDPAQPAEA